MLEFILNLILFFFLFCILYAIEEASLFIGHTGSCYSSTAIISQSMKNEGHEYVPFKPPRNPRARLLITIDQGVLHHTESAAITYGSMRL